MPWAYDDAMCRAQFVSTGLDCSSSQFTSQTFCTSQGDACVSDIPLVACSDLAAGTANLPASCNFL